MGLNRSVSSALAASATAVLLFVASTASAQQPGGGFKQAPAGPSAAQLVAQGDRLAALRKYEAALELYERAAARDDDYTDAFRRIGATQMALQRPERAIAPLQRAANLARDRTDDWIKLGDACRVVGLECAEEAYLQPLRAGPNPEAARALERLGYDPFAHAYDHAPNAHDADDFHPAETGGPALAFGLGLPYGGSSGFQLSYYLLRPELPLAFAPYVGFGLVPAGHEGVNASVAFGVTLLAGFHHRWLLDLGYGVVAFQNFTLYGVTIGEREFYGVCLSGGREWMWSTGITFRAQIGLGYMTDPATYYDDRIQVVVGLGIGWKPW